MKTTQHFGSKSWWLSLLTLLLLVAGPGVNATRGEDIAEVTFYVT